MEPNLKACVQCGEEKLNDEFYRQPKNSDGRFNKCKACISLARKPCLGCGIRFRQERGLCCICARQAREVVRKPVSDQLATLRDIQAALYREPASAAPTYPPNRVVLIDTVEYEVVWNG